MIEQTVRELLEDQVELDIEGIDRIYLNGYQPRLQTGGGVVAFFKEHRGAVVAATTTLMAPMSKAFVAAIHRFAKTEGIDLIHFAKGQHKDEETQRRLKHFEAQEGILYIGVAPEKFAGFRVIKKISERTGCAFPWLYRSTVMCNQYYFYIVDEDFGPLFIKFSSYFPYTARICLNGHEYAKRQLQKADIAFDALDNGVRRYDDPQSLQQILDGLDEVRINAVVRKWFARLPHPFTAEDRAASCRYDLSILQAEFARTQVFDRPLSGRHLFEEVIRENLDLGRPQQVSLIFNRRITKQTPGRFATRAITQGVTPSLHISYKSTKIKQYFKEERALRTETTINNTRDFAIGRRLHNLPALRAIGFAANRRRPTRLGADIRQRAGHGLVPDPVPLRFAARRLSQCAALREHVAQLMGEAPEQYTQGRMSYDLRRLRLHGIIERIPHTHRYQLTALGARVSLFFTKVNARVIRPGLSQLFDGCPKAPNRPVATAMYHLDRSLNQLFAEAKLAA